MAEIFELQCRECSQRYPVKATYYCELCFAPVDPVYDFDEIARSVDAETIAGGPRSLWRYEALLPVSPRADKIDLGTGFTPLVRANRLGAALGIDELYLKNDTANPTHSFKDRVVSVALTVARDMGFSTVACASTGNLANAVAAHAAAAGLKAVVFIPSDLERGKVQTSQVYGATIVSVKGSYDDVNRICTQLAELVDWAFVNVNLRPFYAEGSKTIAFELAEQLGWRAPAHVVVPVASGALLTKIHKGLNEFARVGLIPASHTTIHAAQADGCSPVVDAWEAKTNVIRPVKPTTIARSLAIGNPADGGYAVDVLNATSGSGAKVADSEIVEGIKLLAESEGIFAETAGGVTIAALRKLAKQGAFKGGGPVVALITGTGLKTVEALEGALTPVIEVPPDVEVIREELRSL